MNHAVTKLKHLLAVLSHEPKEVLLSIRGLGKVSAGEILAKREEIRLRSAATVPGLSLLDLTAIPGVGAKKIASLADCKGSTALLDVIKYVVLFQKMCIACQTSQVHVQWNL